MPAPEECRACYFWDRLSGDQGACRRYPPTTIVFNGAKESPAPQTTGDWWCGEFRLRAVSTPE